MGEKEREILLISGNFSQNVTTGVFGYIDDISESGITGWIIDIKNKNSSLELEAVIGDNVVAYGKQSIKREDICKIAHTDIAYGFHLQWNLKNISPDAIDENGNYPIIYLFSDKKVIFANLPVISGGKLKKIIAASSDGGKPFSPRQAKEAFQAVLGREEPRAREQGDVKLIAYYLPQFHPIPENDEWWGPGFTEWSNVAQGTSYFSKHYQPHVPGELGFYDLRLPEIRQAQADLAREYGIYGFCYYYYWFKGKRLLERPLQEVFESGSPDFPFCICWANETWSRRWDGSENEILMQQEHTPETDLQFIYDVIPLFKDPRYIRLNGAPLLLIYRVSLLPDPQTTLELWRRICRENGIPKIHICASATFGLKDPYDLGFDSAAQFPPHHTTAPQINETIEDLPKDYGGCIYDYEEVVRQEIMKEIPTQKYFPAVMTSWDNTPRRKKNGNIFLGATPELYEVWLRATIDKARESLPEGERCVFINAWNEWAEGAHLEPDRKHGRAYLEATRRALTGRTSWRSLIDYAESLPKLEGPAKTGLLADLRAQLHQLELQVSWYAALYGQYGLPKEWTRMKAGIPSLLQEERPQYSGQICIDQVNYSQNPTRPAVDKLQKLYCCGWSFSQGQPLQPSTPTYLLLQDAETGNIRYYGFIPHRLERGDIATTFKTFAQETTQYSGFRHAFEITDVENGSYRLALLTCYLNGIALVESNVIIEIA